MKRTLVCNVCLAVMSTLSLCSSPVWAGTPRPPEPAGNPGTWITPADYPSRALRYEAQGTVIFLLTIDAAGVPSSCKVVETSKSEDLDTQTCSLLVQRARFSPATDANGKAVGGTYRSSVHWTIPEGEPTGPIDIQPMDMVASFTLGPDGKEHDCTIEKMTGKAPFPMSSGLCSGSETYVVASDKDGKPIARRVRVRMSIEVEDLPAAQ